MALPDSLVSLLEDGIIDTVERRLLSGKEASVYVVSRRGEFLAAKVYKPAERRTFKATASYTEGRNQTRNSRDQRAMSKRSNYGKELVEESWRDMEYRALYNAAAAGVRVPRPVLLYGDVLLMELLIDEDGQPAPRLADAELDPHDAEPMFREVFRQVRLLLGTGKVHGDLSAFNILLPQGGPTIIDMPQVVDAPGNNLAREILVRDLQNVIGHLSRFDARLLRFRHCGEILWRHYQMGTLDDATEPQEGSVRGERFGQGRREQLAERGRMGRADSAPQRPGQHAQQPSRAPSSHHEPRRDGVAVREGKGPQQQQQRRDGPPPQQRRDGAPQQQQQQRRDGPPPQQRRDGAPQQQQQRRDGPPPQQRRDGAPQQQQQRRDGAPQQPRRDAPPRQPQQPPQQRRRNGPDYPPVQIDLSRRDNRRPQ